MDIEHKDRRAVASALQTFSRVWPYLTIVTLLVLLAITNYNKPAGSTVSSSSSNHIVRNTLLVRLAKTLMKSSIDSIMLVMLAFSIVSLGLQCLRSNKVVGTIRFGEEQCEIMALSHKNGSYKNSELFLVWRTRFVADFNFKSSVPLTGKPWPLTCLMQDEYTPRSTASKKSLVRCADPLPFSCSLSLSNFLTQSFLAGS